MYSKKLISPYILVFFGLLLCACDKPGVVARHAPTSGSPIDRQAVVERHNPELHELNPQSPFTVGNGGFAFTADVTGLQSLPERYYRQGIPLETKANWAWHNRPNPKHYTLGDTFVSYRAYGKEVSFPTNMESPAGRWLRQNPHDLPLARIGFTLDKHSLEQSMPEQVEQTLDLWRGMLHSRFSLGGVPVSVGTVVADKHDTLAVSIESDLLLSGRLAVTFRFPRGYDPAVKNTPNILWNADKEHGSTIVHRDKQAVTFRRNVDDEQHYVQIRWQGNAQLNKIKQHVFRLVPVAGTGKLEFTVSFLQQDADIHPGMFSDIARSAADAWRDYWMQGAAIDFAGSTNPMADELERRIVLSRYLMAVQERGVIPAQETGLTSSSWYGKHHTEMSWWHSAHWALWGHPEELEKVLNWYVSKLDTAKALAKQRGLDGARWAKMVGPENRESPGGNALIIWNQPQLIHLAELLYHCEDEQTVLDRYAELVEQTAAAMASMLVWDTDRKQYSLDPPIWIAQEIYDPVLTRNPAFELAYWREGLSIAQLWRDRLGKKPNPDWQDRLDHLAPLPQKDGKYVAVESIPDTFDNIASRQDHPSMLAAFGLLNDPTVKIPVMRDTLQAVLAGWDWKNKIWGWDYPMIAMTASRLRQPQTAVDILMADLANNSYLPNGHCPQQDASLPVYLPANGALLSVVAMMAAGWNGAADLPLPGFPNDNSWKIKTEGLMPLP